MTYEPSKEAVEAAKNAILSDDFHRIPAAAHRNAGIQARAALTTALPIELEQERKRWEEEVREQARTEIAEQRRQALSEGDAPALRHWRTVGECLSEVLNTIFGPEEGECERCGGTRTQPDKRGATSAAGCPDCQQGTSNG